MALLFVHWPKDSNVILQGIILMFGYDVHTAVAGYSLSKDNQQRNECFLTCTSLSAKAFKQTMQTSFSNSDYLDSVFTSSENHFLSGK